MQKTHTILSVEDNLPDFILLEKALNNIPDLSLNIINIPNGKDALEFIFKKNEYKTVQTPDLIIIDINIPIISGLDVLRIVKKDKVYKIIPCIIFSTSYFDKDVLESYKSHANSYITKTFDVNELFKKISSLGEYWLKTTNLISPDTAMFLKKE